MAVNAQIITPTAEDWRTLYPAAGSKTAMDSIQDRHQSGQAAVLQINGDAEGLAVVWIESDQTGNDELVAALGAGQGARAFIPWLIEFARANRAASIRTHCQRAGLIHLYIRAGFRITGTDDSNYTVLRWTDGR